MCVCARVHVPVCIHACLSLYTSSFNPLSILNFAPLSIPIFVSIFINLMVFKMAVILTPAMGPFKCYLTFFSWYLGPPPTPHNANNIEPYTFIKLFYGNCDTPHPHLSYITLEWPPYR